MSELPSLVFPLVQILAIVVAIVTLVLIVAGIASPWLIPLGLIVWQLPIFLMSYKKSAGHRRLKQAGGIWALLNVYFTARGQSLFMGAAWQ